MLVNGRNEVSSENGKVNEFSENIETVREILKRYHGDNGMQVARIKCVSGSKDGDNYMSLMKRIIATIQSNNNSEYTISLIFKRQIHDRERRELFRCDHAFENEIAAYYHLIPVLKKFSNNNLPYPNCLFAGSDDYGELIVMEDLTQHGYKMANRIKGMDFEHCALALKELAGFHAISLAMKVIDPVAFYKSVDKLHEVVFTEKSEEFFSNVVESSLSDVISSISNFSNANGELTRPVEILQRLGGQKLFKIMKNHVNESSSNWKVICHGDLWINNIMFHYHNGKVKHVKFVDLQTIRYTNLSCDILMLLYSSTRGEMRQKHLDRLIYIYRESLISNLCEYLEKNYQKELATLEEEFSFENIRKELAMRSLYGLGMSFWVMPAVTFVSLSTVMKSFGRDQATHEEIMTKMQSKEYHTRVRDIVKEFYDRGWLDNIFIDI